MFILVSDAAILITLELGGLLEAMFSCGIAMVIPDLVYQYDFENHNGPYLRSLGLGVVALSPNEVSHVQLIHRQKLGFSFSECFSLVYACRSGHSLISENENLCNAAIARGFASHGFFWIIDRMLASGLVQKELIMDGLSVLHAHPKCNLHRDKIKTKLSELK